MLEEECRFIAQLLEEAPEACSAHFTPSAGESSYPSLWMLIRRPINLPCDLKPINDRLDFTKRHLHRQMQIIVACIHLNSKINISYWRCK